MCDVFGGVPSGQPCQISRRNVTGGLRRIVRSAKEFHREAKRCLDGFPRGRGDTEAYNCLGIWMKFDYEVRWPMILSGGEVGWIGCDAWNLLGRLNSINRSRLLALPQSRLFGDGTLLGE
jgi:hypothetical protein